MKLNLDTVVSNLAALLLECQALKMENMVSVLAEVETLHLAGEQRQHQGFRYECGSTVWYVTTLRLMIKDVFTVIGERRKIRGLLVVITLLKSQQAEQACSHKRLSSKH